MQDYPAWLKNERLEMVWFIDSYGDQMGYTREEYYGKTDFHVQPAHVASIARDNDRYTINLDRPIKFDLHFNGMDVVVVKWPIKTEQGTFVAGAFVTKDICETMRTFCGGQCNGKPSIECVVAMVQGGISKATSSMSDYFRTLSLDVDEIVDSIDDMRLMLIDARTRITRLEAVQQGLQLLALPVQPYPAKLQ